MNTSRILSALALLTASTAFAAWTQDGDGSFSFDAKGPAGLKIHGDAKKLTVTDDGTTMKVQLKLEDVDTDNSLRNRHMLEDMKAKDNPMVNLTVPTASLCEKGGEATGTLELNGQKKDTKFSYTPKCNGSSCEVEASAPVNLNDFGIKIRSYMGVTVKPDIVVTTKFKVVKK